MKTIILAVAAMILLSSCGHHETINDLHTSGDHPGSPTGTLDETESVTLYSQGYEVFAEYDRLYPGRESEFLVHVTNLDEDYSAFSEGRVDILLITGNGEQLVSTSSTKVGGIFKSTLVPAGEGDAILGFIISRDQRADSLLEEIHIYAGNEKDNVLKEPATLAGLIRYTKEQAWKSRFNVMEVKPYAFSRVVKTSGEFLAVPGEKQHVIAKSLGIVLFSSRDLVQGKYVEKGAELFTISGQGLAYNNISVRLSESKINFEKSKSDLARHKVLLAENVISRKQFLETQSRYVSDSILYYSLKETVGSSGMRILAPMSGYLHEMNVSEGQYVEAGQLMATISTNKLMLLRADVPQQYYGMLGQVITANFRPAYTDRVYTMEELGGKLLARGASVAENNHYLPVYFEVVNDGTLLEGAFAEFYLKTASEPGRMVIPVSALVEEQGIFYVFVQVSGELFQKRMVSLSDNDGIYCVVESGLSFGEHVVSEGAMLIKTASSSSIPSHSHEH